MAGKDLKTISHELVIVGGGPAGLAAAASAREHGVKDILIIERDTRPGGILNQCIHNGFGLHTFGEELTGPEYAARYISKVRAEEIPCLLGTIVTDISPDRRVTCISREGVSTIEAGAVILAMGCRERPRGALSIPGFRPAGIYTAGTAQRLMNIEGKKIGKEVVILGSGDIGLIMARRMTLEGAHVSAVSELMPYSGGLKRNIVQCLNDYGIPLLLSHTVTCIHGKEHVEGVTIQEVDAKRTPIPGTEKYYPCDTLLLSCGLLPENELSKAAGIAMNRVTGGPDVDESLSTAIPGIFACGNVLHVHDLVDYVSEEAARAGRSAAAFLARCKDGQNVPDTGAGPAAPAVTLLAEGGVRYTVPQYIHPSLMDDKLVVRFRVDNNYRDRYISVYFDGEQVSRTKKRVLAPGEMEQVTLAKEKVLAHPDLRTITIRLED